MIPQIKNIFFQPHAILSNHLDHAIVTYNKKHVSIIRLKKDAPFKILMSRYELWEITESSGEVQTNGLKRSNSIRGINQHLREVFA